MYKVMAAPAIATTTFEVLHPEGCHIASRRMPQSIVEEMDKNMQRFRRRNVTTNFPPNHHATATKPLPNRQQQSVATPKVIMNQNNSTSNTPMLFSLLPNLPTITREAIAKSNWPQSMAYAWLEKHPEITSMQDWRKEQLFALSTFYFSLQGQRWQPKVSVMNVKDWLSYSVSECRWGGPLNCDRKTGKITSLTLQRVKNLVGSIPPEISLLSDLQRFALFDTDLQTSISNLIPRELASLTKLASLSISGGDILNRHITGTIPSTLGLLSN